MVQGVPGPSGDGFVRKVSRPVGDGVDRRHPQVDPGAPNVDPKTRGVLPRVDPQPPVHRHRDDHDPVADAVADVVVDAAADPVPDPVDPVADPAADPADPAGSGSDRIDVLA